jgi:hypothetical protein
MVSQKNVVSFLGKLKAMYIDLMLLDRDMATRIHYRPPRLREKGLISKICFLIKKR